MNAGLKYFLTGLFIGLAVPPTFWIIGLIFGAAVGAYYWPGGANYEKGGIFFSNAGLIASPMLLLLIIREINKKFFKSSNGRAPDLKIGE